MNGYKSSLEEYYDKANKLRNKMTMILPRSKMAEELKKLKEIQSNGNITIFEEKKIVR